MSKKKGVTPAASFNWRNEWKNMPEFEMENLASRRKIVVHFRNDADVGLFAKTVGQQISPKQPSLWFPYMPPRRGAHLLYIDGEEK
jgi:hypothetical protein